MTDGGRKELILRPATAADKERVLAWRNAPFVVARSSSNRPVEPAEHERWFAAALADPDRRVYLIEVDGTPVGVVRFDRREETAVISVFLAEEHAGRGYGTRAIGEGCRLAAAAWPIRTVRACVRMDNLPSYKSFTRAGFAASIDPGACPPVHHCLVWSANG